MATPGLSVHIASGLRDPGLDHSAVHPANSTALITYLPETAISFHWPAFSFATLPLRLLGCGAQT